VMASSMDWAVARGVAESRRAKVVAVRIMSLSPIGVRGE
jgi:hypothetical protein